jgi:hypothetical protein
VDSDEANKILPLKKELGRLEESASYSAQSQFEQAKLWKGVNLFVGAPASILAAISGAAGLSDAANRVIAAYIALAAAGLGALVTILNTNRRVSQAQSSANAYLEIQTAARQLRLIDLDVISYEEARAQLRELTARRDDVNKTADVPSFYAYWRGQNNIGKGRQSYSIDCEKRSNDG